MGHRPVPRDPAYSGFNCLACFAAGFTPREMWVWFGGLELDPDTEWPPEPMPDSFILEQLPGTPCRWTGGDIDAWHASYRAHTAGGFSSLSLSYGTNTGFVGEGNDCQKSFLNEGEWPFNLFEGGTGIVIPIVSETGLSLAAIAEAANFPTDLDTKMDIIPIDEDYFAAHFYREQYCKDLLVKFAIADF